MINKSQKAWSQSLVSMIIKFLKRWSKRSWNDDHDICTTYPQKCREGLEKFVLICCKARAFYLRINDQESRFPSFCNELWIQFTQMLKYSSVLSWPPCSLLLSRNWRKHDHDIAFYILFSIYFHRSTFLSLILPLSPSLSAFSRKLTVKNHASEDKTHLIIFPVNWSHWKIDVWRTRTHNFLDHAFVFSVLTGSMIMKTPWSYFRLISLFYMPKHTGRMIKAGFPCIFKLKRWATIKH